jgi:hypothetical protein
VHPNNGSAVDPYPYLRKAQPLMFYAKTNSTVSLSLTGTIVSAFAGTLALKTSQIQIDKTKPVDVKRNIVLSLPDETPVSLDMPSMTLGLDALLTGLKAVTYTLPVKATLPVQRGDASILTAARILLNS